MNWIKIPLFLWPRVIRYYGGRLAGVRASVLTSNWVYFLRLTLPLGITIRKKNALYYIHNRQLRHTALMRPAGSDVLVYLQIFFNHEYAALNNLLLEKNAVVVDLGANAGFFMLWAKAKWPSARILCVEPDNDNFELLQKQIAENAISDVQSLRAGIWSREEPLKMVPHNSGLEWAHGVTNALGGDVPGITFDKLLATGCLEKVDLLKIDVEGTEEILFEDPDFLRTLSTAVHHIIMETHHPDRQQSMAATLRELGFEVILDRELIFAKRRGI